MSRVLCLSMLVLIGLPPMVCNAVVSCDKDQPARHADFRRVTATFSGDTLSFSMPSRFEQVNLDRLAALESPSSQYRVWAVPAQQAGRASETIEIRSMRQPAGSQGKMSVSRLAGIHGKIYMTSCPDTFSVGTLPSLIRDTPGDETYAVVLACGDVRTAAPRHSDSSVSYVFRGAQDFYVMTWSVMAEPRSTVLDIDRDQWQARLTSLFPLIVCPVPIK